MTSHESETLYRPSSTLIIVAKSNEEEQGYNYRLLLAKRSTSTAFAPDHYVFPGGVFDIKADENIEWLAHFKSFGITRDVLKKLCLDHSANRPKPLMTDGVNFARDISLRITAIRETFEEVGLLLCISRDDFKLNKDAGNFMFNFDRSHWQHKVHNNAMEFLNLCKYIDVVPDLWSLYEWSIWRSPSGAWKKYDTAIYIVILKFQPKLLLESTEIEKELWSTPLASLKLFNQRLIWLAAMQFYEISRLSNIFDWSKLQTFVKERNFKGSTIIMPIHVKCTDYLVGLLPGDDFYSDVAIDRTGTVQLPLTEMEFKAKTKNIHRITYYDMHKLHITSNITPIDSHLSPVLPILNICSKL